jgi:TIR domain/Pentapeptide repeats (8 copies)
MANQEHVDLLKQGVQIWNSWRTRNPHIAPDLERAVLGEIDLRGANLRGANLYGARLDNADLSNANFIVAQLTAAGLRGAKLCSTELTAAGLQSANLTDANLTDAYLANTILHTSTLIRANFRGVSLEGATFVSADLSGADFTEAKIGLTVFGDIDLQSVKGLETIIHTSPSTIGTDTILRSKGNIPEIFLRKAGMSDGFITYVRSLVNTPIDYYTCFISYSSHDQDFAERLYADLLNKGVRCWYASEDMDIGDEIRPRIDETIRLYDKLLLVFSNHSVASSWVAYEVKKALNKEPQGIPNVLYPIRLDDAVMQRKDHWVHEIRSTRHIGDFTRWKEHEAYQNALNRLLRALKPKPLGEEIRP